MIVLCFDPGKVNLSMCLLRYDVVDDNYEEPQVEILHWENINLDSEAPDTFPAKKTLADYVQLMTLSLQTRNHLFETHHVDVVAIEQQPAGGNNRFSSVNIKVLSHVIQTYYLLRFPQSTTLFVAPSTKLAEYKKQLKAQEETKTEDVEMEDTESKKRRRNYSNNKKLSVDHTRELLQRHGLPEMLDFLNAAGSKKDDLCDAFLLAYHHCKKALKPPRRTRRK